MARIARATSTPDIVDGRKLLKALRSMSRGDFGIRLPLDQTGLSGEISAAFNDCIELNQRLQAELQRINTVVGKEGKITQRATLGEASGAWNDCIQSVNGLVGDLVRPTTEVARVIGAVAKGDLTQTMALEIEGGPLKGEFLRTARTINTMVEQLSSFTSEVTRVAREVGTEGKLGGQAQVKGVSGTWKDLTDSVNSMASNLTGQVRNIADVTTAVANGDLSRKITVDVKGEILELKNTFNTMVDQLSSFASEVTRVAREVGTEGKLGGQADVRGVSGTWKGLTDSVNYMASNLTAQVRNIAEVTTAVANGDLSRKITVDVKGEILELKNTINTMVDQLSSFASEVTRVAREVGTDGKLGGQAIVKGVGGTWKDLTDNVNSMASNLTAQVRNIAEVTTAVANGDLTKKITVDVKGEILELKNTINTMVDQLSSFSSEVTRVARDVGTEGKLGGQALVPGAAGTWRDLTDNVNGLAANLTTQVRAIAEVATAVTKGDLTRTVAVEARGEVASLKDNINEMIRNLKDTTQKNTEQDWLKTNLAKFTSMLQGQRDLLTVANLILSEVAPLVRAQHGVFYINESDEGEGSLKLMGSYAYQKRTHLSDRFKMREGLIGQTAVEKQRILVTNAPEDYVKISSGLGEATPVNIVALPVIFEGDVRAVIELASFQPFSEIHLAFLDQLTESIGIVLNTIEANMRTENLLKQSQSLAQELQAQQQELTETNKRLEQQAKTLQASEDLLTQQQEELQQTNEELEEKARLLAAQNAEVERKNREIEQARVSLEEKAEQLALTSKYKSEFLANMSHELRTPLNSLLILSKLLSDNGEANLTPKQVEFARTIHASGSDLLELINDILDLSKIESGTITLDVGEVEFKDLHETIERNFRQVAETKKLEFHLDFIDALPRALNTDSKRLQQVLKNLLSNAFKFTENGGVTLKVHPASKGWSSDKLALNDAPTVIAFSVTDSGIGIPGDKQRIIFEAFQQADGSTSRKYGGTGLGLPISREIAGLLGGEIRVASAPGEGSTFTLYLPINCAPPVQSTRPRSIVSSYSAPTERPYVALAPAVLETPNETSILLESIVADDRGSIQDDDRVLLIVEDDVTFARLLLDEARESGFKGLVAVSGAAAIALARRFSPDAITLDIVLPDMDGWTVLDRLKHDPKTRHIPVNVISASGQKQRGFKQGAIGYLEKPVTKEAINEAMNTIKAFIERPAKNLLVVEDDEVQRNSIVELIGNGDVETTAVASGAEALELLKTNHFDCMVIDLGLPDMTGAELIKKVQDELGLQNLPIVVYTGKDLTAKEEMDLRQMTEAVIVKEAKSPDRLLDETALFLHRVENSLPESKRRMLQQAHNRDPILSDRKILIVDDDVRNIFALTSILEGQHMNVIYAENGLEAIKLIQDNSDVEIVLMDVMMPEIDGYETTRRIRDMDQFKNLPIIALTAKAMKGDREKCIEAGASDYIAKPVDTEQLMSLLRVWLYQ